MKSLEFLLTLIAFGSVLAFGAVRPVPVALMGTAVGLVAVAAFWSTGWPPLRAAAGSVLGVILLMPLLQSLPLPQRVVSLVSPGRVALLGELRLPAEQAGSYLALSVNPCATSLAFFKLMCYALAFLLGFQFLKRRGRSALVVALIAIGLFEAVYGLVQYLAGWQYVFGYARIYNTDVASGTYVNRDHYAGLLAMTLPFMLAGIWFRVPWRHAPQRAIRRDILVSSETAVWVARLVLFAVVFIGLVFSMSRMGIAAALAGLALVSAIALMRSTKRAGLAMALVVLALPVLYAVWIGLSPVLERFAVLARPGYLETNRLPVWRDTLALIRDYPLLGTGLGTYRWSSLHYQSSFLGNIYEHAHNDYLEFAADIGIPAALLLFGSLWLLVVKVARRALVLERSQDRVLAAGCAGALAALLTHALADFNLQIPANALIFAWIAGTAAALAQTSGSRLQVSGVRLTDSRQKAEGSGSGARPTEGRQ